MYSIKRKETCAKISEEKDYEIIHPYDNYNVIAGQATIAYEMMKEQSLDNLDAILVRYRSRLHFLERI